MTKTNQYQPQSVPHPGATLEEKLLEMRMGPKEFAIRAGKPEKTVTAILNGSSSITPEMSVRFENVTNIPAHYWMNHQRGYDEYIARERWKAEIESAIGWAGNFPLAEMVKKGWLPPDKTTKEQTAALLGFFGFASHHAWEDYYLNQKLKVAFSISLKNTPEPYAISVWLRKGELQAVGLKADEFVEKRFKETLPQINLIRKTNPADSFNQIQNLCLAAGVKLVFTPCLSKAPINGSAHWHKDTPLIQLSGKNGRAKSMWSTFFHEAGHILLHGKKDIFLESGDLTGRDVEKEKQADEFARKIMG
jgi:HTH-type transcriptional regulator/antitoxin HigA